MMSMLSKIELRALTIAYRALLRLPAASSIWRAKNQTTYAALRDRIAELSDTDSEQIQNRFERRIACEGKVCPASRAPRLNDPWPRWICPKCWAHARADTRAGICRLREQLSKAWRRNNRADIDTITKRLFVVWDMANSQINAGINRKNREAERHEIPQEAGCD